MIKQKFEVDNLSVRQAYEDADYFIVNTAIEMTSIHQYVVFIGADIDLLVLLTTFSQFNNVYFMKPGKVSQTIYSTSGLEEKAAVENVLLLQAFSGCDSRLRFSATVKQNLLKASSKPQNCFYLAQLFQTPNAKPIYFKSWKSIFTSFVWLQT